jgi:hypothetical protein
MPPFIFPSSRASMWYLKSGIAPGSTCISPADVGTNSHLLLPMNEFLLASEQVTVDLRANFTHPAAPGINVNPSMTFSWSAEGCAGVRQYAYQSDAVYTPLFCLRSIRRPWLRRDEMGLGKEA